MKSHLPQNRETGCRIEFGTARTHLHRLEDVRLRLGETRERPRPGGQNLTSTRQEDGEVVTAAHLLYLKAVQSIDFLRREKNICASQDRFYFILTG